MYCYTAGPVNVQGVNFIIKINKFGSIFGGNFNSEEIERMNKNHKYIANINYKKKPSDKNKLNFFKTKLVINPQNGYPLLNINRLLVSM